MEPPPSTPPSAPLRDPLPPPSELQQIPPAARLRATLPLLGPAFVAAIAYVDPGNFATNIAGGAKYGYMLLWVVLAANLMGDADPDAVGEGRHRDRHNLPELCRDHLPRPASSGCGSRPRLIAMSTDLAEFVGAAIALNLLFGVPLFVAGLMTAVVAFAILALQSRGYRRFELAIGGDARASSCSASSTRRCGSAPTGARPRSGFVPRFDGGDAVLLATGILGATVMPHVIYLHSALTQERIRRATTASAGTCCASMRIDVLIAMALAGIVNMPMLIIAASLFHGSGLTRRRHDRGRPRRLRARSSAAARRSRSRCALLASGLASSSVGTYAGQVVMQGFIARTIPLAAAAARDDDAGADRARDRARPDARARDQPGRAVVRDPVRAVPLVCSRAAAT